MSTIRTFTAIELSSEVCSTAVRLIERLRSTPAKVAWSRPDNLHITLKFLGDVQADQIDDVCRAVHEAAAPFTPFDLIVAGVGAFPSLSRPKTIWLGTGEGTEQAVLLFQAIERNLKPLGIPQEHRRYTPHLTLGRVRSISPNSQQLLVEALKKHANLDAGALLVHRVTVFSSTLSRTGAIHETLAHAELEG